MEDDFIKIDLHIHTPSSSCYKGHKGEDEYLRILSKAKAQELKIISFTDHNSIEGYKTVLKIKDRITSEKRSLSLITDSEQAKSRLQILEKNLATFDDILILPGIEFEVRNGVHLLVIFNDNVPLEQINKFLMDGGYGPDNFGAEETSNLSNWDIFTLFEESKKYDCIVIDAHTDSNKGILNTIRGGAPRANCFKSSQLSAVCYKNEEQKEKLQHILRSSKEYYRTIPLSFLKFSDAHIADEVGSPSTWVKLEKRSFESLKNAFSNPSELVSIEEPSMVKILDDLLQLPNAFGIPDLSAESHEIIKKHICALANTDGGYILLGVTYNKGKIGIPVKKGPKKEAYRQLFDQIISCVKGVEPYPRPSLNIYLLQANKVIVSLNIPKSTTLINLTDDGLVYAIKDNSISVLKAADIEYLVKDKVVKDIELKISKRLQSVENDCNLIKNLFSSLPIIRFFDKNSVEARLTPSLAKSINLNPDDIEKLKKRPGNGTSRGTIFFFKESTPPRLPYTYLRYTLPLFILHNIYPRSILRDTIYIVPGGGVYYSNRDYPFFSERYEQIIKLYKTPKASKYSMKFTVCFLKSSFLLWYLMNKYDDIDLYKPNSFNNLRFPVLNLKRPDIHEILHTIESNFDEIVNLETTFLINVNKVKKDELDEYIMEHNGRVDTFSYDIDNLIYKLIGLSNDDILTIENNLQLNNIYLPKKTPQLVSC